MRSAMRPAARRRRSCKRRPPARARLIWWNGIEIRGTLRVIDHKTGKAPERSRSMWAEAPRFSRCCMRFRRRRYSACRWKLRSCLIARSAEIMSGLKPEPRRRRARSLDACWRSSGASSAKGFYPRRRRRPPARCATTGPCADRMKRSGRGKRSGDRLEPLLELRNMP